MKAMSDDLHDSAVVDQTGALIGTVRRVYLDDDTGQPSWVTVRRGFLDDREVFVPLERVLIGASQIKVPYRAGFVAAAPAIDPGQLLDAAAEALLREYYGLPAHQDGPGDWPPDDWPGDDDIPDDAA